MQSPITRSFVAASLVAAAVSIAAPRANAAVIDFRTAPWGPGGAASETNGAVTVSADSPLGGVLSWSISDGFGVDSDLVIGRFELDTDREDDEVNNAEILRVSFLGGAAVDGFLVTDLYRESGYNEVGYYRINSGIWTSFAAPNANVPGTTNGELWVSFASQTVNTLTFGYPVTLTGGDRNDFSVAGVRTTNAVPEPTLLMLFGLGLTGLAARTRRRTPTAA